MAAEKPASNYAQILKSSSVMGGAQILGYLISTVRTKVIAVLIGPSGVGLLGLYVSATELIGNLARLGINDSGVREVAEAQGSGDSDRVAHTIKTLRRVCWLTGIAGWLLTAALAYPLSLWAFGTADRAWSVTILGSTLLFGAISGGQTALLQGTRRIGDVARLNVLSGAAATVVGAAIYAVLREDGIVPVLICTAIINLGLSWTLSRSIHTADVQQSWSQTFRQSRRLITLGLAFMWSALLGSIVALGIRSLIVRHLGLDANGIYQAAIGISTIFGGLVLGAMSTDFYPHLTATVRDHAAATRLVNDQTEIGLLLALPGLQATLAFAPWLVRLFYSGDFISGSALLPWYVVSVLCRMVTFPLGYVLVAKGAGARYALITSGFHIINLAGCAILIPRRDSWGGNP
ncbi:MAG: oligosaccharide flippase family protein [Steroidobacteraceae bacterium]